MGDTVFILGAGASKDSGAPLMFEFLDRSYELWKQGKVGVFGADYERVFKIISELQSVHSKAALDLDNIESVFAALELGELINKLPGISDDEIKECVNSMIRLIFSTLDKTINYPVKNGKIYPTTSYDAFVNLIMKINETGGGNRCSIITFNYDLALDYALNFNNYPADYCLDDSRKTKTIPLMKLHGSLNWTLCSECNEIIPWTIKDFFKEYHFPELDQRKSVKLDIAYKLSGSDRTHCEKKLGPDPLLVPPTWNKTKYSSNFSPIWEYTAKVLSNAENVFISGYSLPESDHFFRYLYALGSVGKTRIKRFWIFDPDESNLVEDRYRQLIGPGTLPRFEFHRWTFANAIETIRNTMLH